MDISRKAERKKELLFNASKGSVSDRAEVWRRVLRSFSLGVLRSDSHADGTRDTRSDPRVGWSVRMLSDPRRTGWSIRMLRRRSTWISADALCADLDGIGGIRHATLPLLRGRRRRRRSAVVVGAALRVGGHYVGDCVDIDRKDGLARDLGIIRSCHCGRRSWCCGRWANRQRGC